MFKIPRQGVSKWLINDCYDITWVFWWSQKNDQLKIIHIKIIKDFKGVSKIFFFLQEIIRGSLRLWRSISKQLMQLSKGVFFPCVHEFCIIHTLGCKWKYFLHINYAQLLYIPHGQLFPLKYIMILSSMFRLVAKGVKQWHPYFSHHNHTTVHCQAVYLLLLLV